MTSGPDWEYKREEYEHRRNSPRNLRHHRSRLARVITGKLDVLIGEYIKEKRKNL